MMMTQKKMIMMDKATDQFDLYFSDVCTIILLRSLLNKQDSKIQFEYMTMSFSAAILCILWKGNNY